MAGDGGIEEVIQSSRYNRQLSSLPQISFHSKDKHHNDSVHFFSDFQLSLFLQSDIKTIINQLIRRVRGKQKSQRSKKGIKKDKMYENPCTEMKRHLHEKSKKGLLLWRFF